MGRLRKKQKHTKNYSSALLFKVLFKVLFKERMAADCNKCQIKYTMAHVPIIMLSTTTHRFNGIALSMKAKYLGNLRVSTHVKLSCDATVHSTNSSSFSSNLLMVVDFDFARLCLLLSLLSGFEFELLLLRLCRFSS